MKSEFQYIYGKKKEPDFKPSESHMIPESLGAQPTLNDAVCIDCNTTISRQVEEPFAAELGLLRNMLQIEGKRGTRAPFKAKAFFLDMELDNFILRTPQELSDKLFTFRRVRSEDGKKEIIFPATQISWNRLGNGMRKSIQIQAGAKPGRPR